MPYRPWDNMRMRPMPVVVPWDIGKGCLVCIYHCCYCKSRQQRQHVVIYCFFGMPTSIGRNQRANCGRIVGLSCRSGCDYIPRKVKTASCEPPIASIMHADITTRIETNYIQETVLLMGQIMTAQQGRTDVGEEKENICFAATMVMGGRGNLGTAG